MTFALCRLHDGAPAPAPALPASRTVERDRAAQTFVELHPGLIAHQPTRLGGRGERALHFTRARGFVFRQDRYAGQSANAIPQVVDAHAVAAADVEHLAGHVGRGRAGGEQVRVHDVRDVDEVAGLGPVAVDRGRLARERRGDEARYDGGVLRLRVLARADAIEVAQDHGLEAVRRMAGEVVPFARELGRGIRAERMRDMVLAVGQYGRAAVCRGGAGIHHPADARVARGEEDV